MATQNSHEVQDGRSVVSSRGILDEDSLSSSTNCENSRLLAQPQDISGAHAELDVSLPPPIRRQILDATDGAALVVPSVNNSPQVGRFTLSHELSRPAPSSGVLVCASVEDSAYLSTSTTLSSSGQTGSLVTGQLDGIKPAEENNPLATSEHVPPPLIGLQLPVEQSKQPLHDQQVPVRPLLESTPDSSVVLGDSEASASAEVSRDDDGEDVLQCLRNCVAKEFFFQLEEHYKQMVELKDQRNKLAARLNIHKSLKDLLDKRTGLVAELCLLEDRILLINDGVIPADTISCGGRDIPKVWLIKVLFANQVLLAGGRLKYCILCGCLKSQEKDILCHIFPRCMLECFRSKHELDHDCFIYDCIKEEPVAPKKLAFRMFCDDCDVMAAASEKKLKDLILTDNNHTKSISISTHHIDESADRISWSLVYIVAVMFFRGLMVNIDLLRIIKTSGKYCKSILSTVFCLHEYAKNGLIPAHSREHPLIYQFLVPHEDINPQLIKSLCIFNKYRHFLIFPQFFVERDGTFLHMQFDFFNWVLPINEKMKRTLGKDDKVSLMKLDNIILFPSEDERKEMFPKVLIAISDKQAEHLLRYLRSKPCEAVITDACRMFIGLNELNTRNYDGRPSWKTGSIQPSKHRRYTFETDENSDTILKAPTAVPSVEPSPLHSSAAEPSLSTATVSGRDPSLPTSSAVEPSLLTSSTVEPSLLTASVSNLIIRFTSLCTPPPLPSPTSSATEPSPSIASATEGDPTIAFTSNSEELGVFKRDEVDHFRAGLESYLLLEENLVANGYPRQTEVAGVARIVWRGEKLAEIKRAGPNGEGGVRGKCRGSNFDPPSHIAMWHQCCRCGKSFVILNSGQYDVVEECSFHKRQPRKGGEGGVLKRVVVILRKYSILIIQVNFDAKLAKCSPAVALFKIISCVFYVWYILS